MKLSSLLNICINWLCVCLLLGEGYAETEHDYLQRRNMLLKAETRERTGGDLVLSSEEQTVNKWLMKLKHQEIHKARQTSDGTDFPPAMHFFHAKAKIEKSPIFKFIQAMPKGAALHLHDTSMVSSDWVIHNVTYRDQLYMCVSQKKGVLLQFAKTSPKPQDCKWILVEDMRKNFSNPAEFDNYLEQQITMLVSNPEKEHANQTLLWKKFYGAFKAINGAVCCDEVFKDYYVRALQEFYEDNVQYLEIRTVMPEIYSLDGRKHDHTWFLSTLLNATHDFTKSHPDFIGAKMINSITRNLGTVDVLSSIKETIALKSSFPDFLIGYDLVGQEDTGRPLVADIEALLYPSQQNIDLKFFFHAGETDWIGEDVDINIIDALLLNTSRIGHGYAIIKHPEAMKMARRKGVPLEVNPISNQVLGLVADLRNHPMAPLLADGFPMVVSADDPGLWGAKGVSYDWYEMYMGPGGSWADLATLKKLAMDSIRYSGLSESEKEKAMQLWKNKWDTFIEKQYHAFL